MENQKRQNTKKILFVLSLTFLTLTLTFCLPDINDNLLFFEYYDGGFSLIKEYNFLFKTVSLFLNNLFFVTTFGLFVGYICVGIKNKTLKILSIISMAFLFVFFIAHIALGEVQIAVNTMQTYIFPSFSIGRYYVSSYLVQITLFGVLSIVTSFIKSMVILLMSLSFIFVISGSDLKNKIKILFIILLTLLCLSGLIIILLNTLFINAHNVISYFLPNVYGIVVGPNHIYDYEQMARMNSLRIITNWIQLIFMLTIISSKYMVVLLSLVLILVVLILNLVNNFKSNSKGYKIFTLVLFILLNALITLVIACNSMIMITSLILIFTF